MVSVLSKIDELQALDNLLERCQQELSVFQGHQSLITDLRESVALLRYDQPQRLAAKKKALRTQIAILRTHMDALQAPTSGPRERFKTAQKAADTLTAIRQLLKG